MDEKIWNGQEGEVEVYGDSTVTDTATVTNVDNENKTITLSKFPGQRFWFQGKLISREEHDALSWEEVHADNNVIRSSRLGPRPNQKYAKKKV